MDERIASSKCERRGRLPSERRLDPGVAGFACIPEEGLLVGPLLGHEEVLHKRPEHGDVVG